MPALPILHAALRAHHAHLCCTRKGFERAREEGREEGTTAIRTVAGTVEVSISYALFSAARAARYFGALGGRDAAVKGTLMN